MNKYQITNGKIYTERYDFEGNDLYISGDRITDKSSYLASDGEGTVIDAAGGYVIPGLTDIHFHGCSGYDCCDATPEALRAIADYEAQHGVTTITPATMTIPEDLLMRIAQTVASCTSDAGIVTETGAVLAGLYMEGPFISPAKKGAQKESAIRKPDLTLFERLQDASGGRFRTVALAPETEGAIDLIHALAGKITLSLAHTTADYDTSRRAFEAGASQVTHLYNAMPPYLHRAPGLIGAAADDPDCMVELICDGVHIHPAVVRTTFKIFGPERIIMISDSLRATGMPDGRYELGGQTFTVQGKRALLEDGTLAGSTSTLMDCLRTTVKDMGIPLTDAIRCAAVNPARAIGIDDRYGTLAPGKYANIVILNTDLSLRAVYMHGRIIALEN
ncbi:MAG: N-acetylglucosamine-6-phosphate deacetylase [Clostridiales bacterium]|nr:N-acetylglucosamine-6-phosphate deacetylase [Clostridiales bacterium]